MVVYCAEVHLQALCIFYLLAIVFSVMIVPIIYFNGIILVDDDELGDNGETFEKIILMFIGFMPYLYLYGYFFEYKFCFYFFSEFWDMYFLNPWWRDEGLGLYSHIDDFFQYTRIVMAGPYREALIRSEVLYSCRNDFTLIRPFFSFVVDECILPLYLISPLFYVIYFGWRLRSKLKVILLKIGEYL
jgi:hypothetical protein